LQPVKQLKLTKQQREEMKAEKEKMKAEMKAKKEAERIKKDLEKQLREQERRCGVVHGSLLATNLMLFVDLLGRSS